MEYGICCCTSQCLSQRKLPVCLFPLASYQEKFSHLAVRAVMHLAQFKTTKNEQVHPSIMLTLLPNAGANTGDFLWSLF